MTRGEPIALNGNVGVCDSHQVRMSFYAVGPGPVAIFAKHSEAKMGLTLSPWATCSPRVERPDTGVALRGRVGRAPEDV
jgi:hypothetical protein